MRFKPGQVIGCWTVVNRFGSRPSKRHQHIYWTCECRCGNLRLVGESTLVRSSTGANNVGCERCSSAGRTRDLTGKTFGEWEVLLERTSAPNVLPVMYRCRCSCGLEQEVGYSHLVRAAHPKCNTCYLRHATKDYSCPCGERDPKNYAHVKHRCRACDRRFHRNGVCACGRALYKTKPCVCKTQTADCGKRRERGRPRPGCFCLACSAQRGRNRDAERERLVRRGAR